jgi:hypothetical protein
MRLLNQRTSFVAQCKVVEVNQFISLVADVNIAISVPFGYCGASGHKAFLAGIAKGNAAAAHLPVAACLAVKVHLLVKKHYIQVSFGFACLGIAVLRIEKCGGRLAGTQRIG